MDIKEFYPSRTQETLTKALNFAKEHTTITDEEIRTLFHCRKSLLIHDAELGKRKHCMTAST